MTVTGAETKLKLQSFTLMSRRERVKTRQLTSFNCFLHVLKNLSPTPCLQINDSQSNIKNLKPFPPIPPFLLPLPLNTERN